MKYKVYTIYKGHKMVNFIHFILNIYIQNVMKFYNVMLSTSSILYQQIQSLLILHWSQFDHILNVVVCLLSTS